MSDLIIHEGEDRPRSQPLSATVAAAGIVVTGDQARQNVENYIVRCVHGAVIAQLVPRSPDQPEFPEATGCEHGCVD